MTRTCCAVVVTIAMLTTPVHADIRALCAKRWPNDFELQRTCINSQAEASKKIKQWIRGFGAPAELDQAQAHYIAAFKQGKIWAKILTTCSTRWEQDVVLRQVCIETQASAARQLGKKLD